MKAKSKTRKPLGIYLMLAAAVVLLLGGTVGGARAALSESAEFTGEMGMQNIGVALYENGEEAGEELLGDLLGEGEVLAFGKTYSEVLTAKNTGSIPEYVRMTIYRYWTDGEGKDCELDPALIGLKLGDWKVDEALSTKERTVLYYNGVLQPGDETSAALTGISVNMSGDMAKAVTKTQDGKTITYTYYYDGYQIGLKAEVDAVQTHNAADAMQAAWGSTAGLS